MKKWVTAVLVGCMYLVSIILIAQATYCLLWPSAYPSLENIKLYRSLENPPIIDNEEAQSMANISIIQFTDFPIIGRETYDFNLKNVDELQVHFVLEIRLTSNEYEVVPYPETRFLKVNLIDSVQALIDGQNLNLYIRDFEGESYYTIPSFNLTKENEIKRFEIDFTVSSIKTYPALLTRIPWIYNSAYAKAVPLPFATIPIQKNNESDFNILKITLDSPFQEILTQQSGFKDGYIDEIDSIYFYYPVIQEVETYGNTYSFKITLSETNAVNQVEIVLIPQWIITALLFVFLLAPFYVPLFEWAKKRMDKEIDYRTTRKKKIKISPFWKIVKLNIQIYFGLIMLVVGFILGGETNIQLLTYLTEIVSFNFIGVIFIFLYPLFFSVFWQLFRKF